MTPSKLATLIRWKAHVDSNSPYDNTSLLPVVNSNKDDLAVAIAKENEDYFEEESTFETVIGQGEYTEPDDLMMYKGIAVSYSGLAGSWIPARKVSLTELSMGEDYYELNQPTDQPLWRPADTGFRIYPAAISGTAGAAYGRIYYIPKRSDLANLTESVTDIKSTTGIGSEFHDLLVDLNVIDIKQKEGTIRLDQAMKLKRDILDNLVPAVFKLPGLLSANIPSDRHLQF